MKKNLLYFILVLPLISLAQFGDYIEKPFSVKHKVYSSQIKTFEVQADQKIIDSLTADEQLFCAGYKIPTEILFTDFTLVNVDANGDKLYQLKLNATESKGISIDFNNLCFEEGAKLWVINSKTKDYVGAYSKKDENKYLFRTSVLEGDEFIIEYLEPSSVTSKTFAINGVYYFFRGLKSTDGFGGAQYCMLNAACSEGNDYRASFNATCRIIVYGGGNSYFCTGSLMNNTREDASPYILTANHCSKNSVLSDLNQWEFHFFYQSSTCQTPLIEPIKVTFLGATAPAYTGSDNGDYSSDFLLCKLKSPLPINTYNFTFLGWDRSPNASNSGVCFHHAAGDIKKVSTYTSQPKISSYRGNVQGTHFEMTWTPTTNGFSVTEGGSSGSGLLNNLGLLTGTLTGGSSSCSNKYEADYYGRLYYHWDKNGTNANVRLKDWLDPDKTEKMTCRTALASALSISEPINNIVFNISNTQSKLIINSTRPDIKASLYNIVGEKIDEFNTRGFQLDIDISSYPRDMYILLLESNNHVETYKFLH